MSNGRRHRRTVGRRPWEDQPAGYVELDARARRLLAQTIAAHDDEAVSLADFVRIGGRMQAYAMTLSPAERREVAGQLAAHITGARYLGWSTPAEPSA